MKTRRFLKTAAVPVALLTAALIVAARHQGTPISSAAAAPTAPTAPAETKADDTCHFKEGNGVRLGKSAWKFIQPATSEVQTLEVAPDLKAEARVYTVGMTSTRQALASAAIPAGTTLNPGEAVQLSSTASGEPTEWQGKVVRIDQQMEPVSGQVEAIIEVADPDHKLTAGAFLTMRAAPAAKMASVPVAPWSAVVQSSKGPFVYAANGEYFLRTPVKLGARHGDQVEITDGLFEGDKVASKGADALWMVELQATNGGKSCCAAGH